MTTVCLRASANESTAALLDRAAAAGFSAVECSFAVHVGQDTPAPEEEARLLREAADRAKTQIAALRIACDEPMSFGDPATEVRDRTAAMIRAAIDAAAVCGAEVVVVPPDLFRRSGSRQLPRDEAYAKLLDAFAQIRFHALHRGITVACDFCRSPAFTSIGETRGFVDWVNSPFVGVSISANDDSGSDTSAEWIALLGHRVKHVSIESPAMDLRAAFAAQGAAHFDGVISLSGADAGALRNEVSGMMGLSAAG